MLVFSLSSFTLFNFFIVQLYGFFLILGLLIFTYFFLSRARVGLGQSYEDLMAIVLWGVGAAVVGARLAYVLENPNIFTQGLASLCDVQTGGLSVIGSLFAVPIVLIARARANNIEVLKLLDVVSLYVPILDAFGRLGCLVGGCCFGFPYKAWFSIKYLNSCVAAPCGVLLFPAQFLTVVLFVALFLILYALMRHFGSLDQRPTGLLTAVYLMGAAFIRFGVDFIRGDRGELFCSIGMHSITAYQLVSLVLGLAAGIWVCLILWLNRKN